MINVNDVRKQIIKSGSLTSAVGTGYVYDGSYNKYARKRELNLRVSSSGDKNIMMRHVPIFDDEDLRALRSEANSNKYIHIGCLTISIEPLMHKRYMDLYGDKMRGICAVIDTTFADPAESIISAHRYELSKGRADFVSMPNHCLSLLDPNLKQRLSVMISLDGINVKKGNEMFNVCIGYIVTGVNTLNPTKAISMSNIPITGTSECEPGDLSEDMLEGIKGSNGNLLISHDPSDDDIYIKSKGSFLSNLSGKTKIIKRRTMRAKPIDITPVEHSSNVRSIASDEHLGESERRSCSKISASDCYQALNHQAVLKRAMSSRYG